MIKGHIWDYLIFTLSFIGWILLVAFTFGIAYIWVGPYMQMSYANFYNYIKEDKLNNYKKKVIYRNFNRYITMWIYSIRRKCKK